MLGLYFLFPTLLAIFISFLFVKAAAIALMMTGLEKNKARFQALSAFTGTGFTTKEAEIVVKQQKKTEEEDGTATFEETKSLTFRTIK